MSFSNYWTPANILIVDRNDSRTTPSAYRCRKDLGDVSEAHVYKATLVQEGAYTGGIYYSSRNEQFYRTYGNLTPGTTFVKATHTHRPALISIDNGQFYQTADELFHDYSEDFKRNFNAYWTQIVDRMDDELREEVHGNYGDCDELTFLRAYCERAEEDICIG